MIIDPPPLPKENPDIREIRKLARKANEIQVCRTSRTEPGYWDVWADKGAGFLGIAQWPTSAIDELSAHNPEVWDSDTGLWRLKTND